MGGEAVGEQARGQGQSAAPAAAAGSAPKFTFGVPKAGDKPAPASTGGFTFGSAQGR